MEYPPSFDGRAVCYPSFKILRDYLSWRQVDCHINNQYNSCFYLLVNTCGLSPCDAQNYVKGMQTQEKNNLLKRIDYSGLLEIFRKGSCIFWNKAKNIEDSQPNIVTEHCDIIDDAFWKLRPWILGDE